MGIIEKIKKGSKIIEKEVIYQRIKRHIIVINLKLLMPS